MLLQLVEKKDTDPYLSLTDKLPKEGISQNKNFQAMLQNNFFDLGKLLRNDALAALKARGKFGSPDAENEMRNPNRVTNGRPPPINNYGFSTDPASVPERDQTLATSKPELAKLIEHNKKYDQELYNRRKNFADEWTFCPEVKNVKVQGYSLKHLNEFQHSKLRISTGPWTKPFQLELENLKLFGGQLFRLISGIEEIMRANINRETNTLELTLIYPPKLWIPQDVDKEEEQMTVANLLEDCSQFEVFPWSMTIPLQYDIMNRGLANRLDLLAKLSQRIGEKLMVDGVVYKHNPQDMVPDNFRQPIALSSKRQEQPMMVPVRPIGQQPGPNNQPPETSASNEQRIFESNFAKNELQDFKVFEAGTLASKLLLDGRNAPRRQEEALGEQG